MEQPQNTRQRQLKRKLVIVNQWAGYLFVDLANEGLNHYDEVVLLAGRISELNTSLANSVTVDRLPEYRRGSLGARLISWIGGFISIIIKLRRKYAGYDVLLSTNPPLATWVPLFARNSVSLYVLDLYPEALQMTGMLGEHNLICRAWKALNAITYRKFKQIFVLTDGMKAVIELYEVSGVQVIPPWSSILADRSKGEMYNVPILNELDLNNCFIVLYAGNLGKEHDIEALVTAAEHLKSSEIIKFVIMGGGWKHQMIAEHVRESGLENVLMLPFQESDKFNEILAASHLGVVAQSISTATVCIPSKTFNLLAAGKPLLVIGSPDSDLGRMIAENYCGGAFASDDGESLAGFIEYLAVNPAAFQEMSEAASKYAQHFTAANASTLIKSMADLHA